MPESNYLAGKVRKHSLPAFDGPAPTDAPVIKRLLLAQGELAQFYDDDQEIHYIAFIELRPETVRGNHFHKVKKEYIYVLRGEFLLLLEEVDSKERLDLPMKAGDTVLISTGVAHTLRISAAGMAVEYSAARFNAADTYRYPIS